MNYYVKWFDGVDQLTLRRKKNCVFLLKSLLAVFFINELNTEHYSLVCQGRKQSNIEKHKNVWRRSHDHSQTKKIG